MRGTNSFIDPSVSRFFCDLPVSKGQAMATLCTCSTTLIFLENGFNECDAVVREVISGTSSLAGSAGGLFPSNLL